MLCLDPLLIPFKTYPVASCSLEACQAHDTYPPSPHLPSVLTSMYRVAFMMCLPLFGNFEQHKIW